jgi:palmitoyl-protein thioesterase
MFYIRLLVLLLTPFTTNNVTGVKSFPVFNNNNIINYFDNSDIYTIPVVVLHGVASSAGKMVEFSDWISNTFNRKVFNIEIGNGESTSLYTPLPEQLFLLCNILYSITELENGFDFIGMSQGGLLARGYVERCNKFPVLNLITMVSPHGGVKNGLTLNMYTDFLQEHLSVAGYWRDPTEMVTYLDKCVYLPLLNNERNSSISFEQKENIKSLQNFVLIWSSEDTTVVPPESAKFSFYDEDYKVIDIRDTELYQLDLLGLKYLDEIDGFHVHETNCSHVEHRDPVCYDQIYEILKFYL